MKKKNEYLIVNGKRHEVVRHGPSPDEALTLVFLHEGLGCVSMWGDFPERLAAATGCGALVYSRSGYGRSDPCDLPRSIHFMHDEGRKILPELLKLAGIRKCILIGHSDGGSIAIIYAGSMAGIPLLGLITESAHVFCEQKTLASIRKTRVLFNKENLRRKLKQYHGDNTECAFWGWNSAWLHPDFKHWNLEKYVSGIKVSMLVIQGENDEYGTPAQVESIARLSGAGTEVLMLSNCGHNPHREQDAVVFQAMKNFIYRIKSKRRTAMQEKKQPLTTAAGAPVPDNQNVMTAGPRGPQLLQDVWFLEKLAHFDREVIPERRMHAKGSGAFGAFTITHDITKYTKAKIFSEIGKQTNLFVRFSTVAGERGAADAERDIRGFAIKFYSEEGNWDLVGNNTPVFFLRDPLKFPDLNHAVKRDPKTNMRSDRNNWDFWTNLPETLHQVTITMSDRGIPLSYRHMNGYGSHTYSLINAQNERTWVKFHLKTAQDIKCLTDQEAEAIVAKDRESHQRDLFDHIEAGDFPKWNVKIQVMTEAEASRLPYNPFDLTKVWSHKDYPLIDVGVLELNRNPENYFADVEQAAFNPANIVPGIGFSPDKMLQGRLFSYGDAQRYRLGVNHNLIPVNAARCPVHGFHRDGQMRVDGNYGATLGYEPNSYGEWQEQPDTKEPPLALEGAADHWSHREDDDDYYSQPRNLFRLMSPEQKQVLFENTARAMGDAPQEIKIRHIGNCRKAVPAYGEGVARALGISMNEEVC